MAEQRAQFILVNSTKPLPKGLIHELLPVDRGAAAARPAQKRLPALLLERLNYDDDSPLRGRIRTPTSGERHDQGQLDPEDAREQHQRRRALPLPLHATTADPTSTAMLAHPQGLLDGGQPGLRAKRGSKPPRRSRLTHGLGIVSLGFLMDAIAEQFEEIEPDVADFVEHLELIAPRLRLDGRLLEARPLPAQVERPPEHAARRAGRSPTTC